MKRRRKKNAGHGYGMDFHGAFSSKEDAKKKERKVHGFIRPTNIKGERRYVVMSPRKNPRRRKRNPKLYSLFEKIGGKWQQIDSRAFPRSQATRVFQSALLAYSMGRAEHQRRLMPVKGANPEHSHAGPVPEECLPYFYHDPYQQELERQRAAHGNPMDLVVMGANPHRRRRRNQELPPEIEQRVEDLDEIRRQAFEDAAVLGAFGEGGGMGAYGAPNTRRSNVRLHRINPEAAELREQFVGEESMNSFPADEPHMPKGEYAQLGKLVGITFKPEEGAQVEGVGWYEGADKVSLHEAAKALRKLLDAPVLVSDASGSQLYLVGGNQDLSGMLDFVPNPRRNPEGLWELGEAQTIVYRERKAMNNFDTINYEHKFGEENGEKPMLLYDEEKQRIIIDGGDYKVRPEGIVN